MISRRERINASSCRAGSSATPPYLLERYRQYQISQGGDTPRHLRKRGSMQAPVVLEAVVLSCISQRDTNNTRSRSESTRCDLRERVSMQSPVVLEAVVLSCISWRDTNHTISRSENSRCDLRERQECHHFRAPVVLLGAVALGSLRRRWENAPGCSISLVLRGRQLTTTCGYGTFIWHEDGEKDLDEASGHAEDREGSCCFRRSYCPSRPRLQESRPLTRQCRGPRCVA